MIQKSTELGNIDLSNDVIATICGGAATECYGVVGMASQKMIDGIYDLLRKENYSIMHRQESQVEEFKRLTGL
jgi:uncharacterized alkaline shock family protein YloU